MTSPNPPQIKCEQCNLLMEFPQDAHAFCQVEGCWMKEQCREKERVKQEDEQ